MTPLTFAVTSALSRGRTVRARGAVREHVAGPYCTGTRWPYALTLLGGGSADTVPCASAEEAAERFIGGVGEKRAARAVGFSAPSMNVDCGIVRGL